MERMRTCKAFFEPHTPEEYHEKKHDQGKTRWDLVPWGSVEGVAEILTFGAAKYSEESWREVPDAAKRYFSAMMRHRSAMQRGEYTDPESGKPHRFHFLCNAMFLCELAADPEWEAKCKELEAEC